MKIMNIMTITPSPNSVIAPPPALCILSTRNPHLRKQDSHTARNARLVLLPGILVSASTS